MDFDTLLLHGDGDGDTLSPPIYQTTAFRASSQSEFRETARSDRPPRFYTRYGNPTLERVASLLAQLEGAEAGLLCASGMGAISTALLSLLTCGDHIVAQRNLYNGTVDLLEKLLSRFGVTTTFVDAGDSASIERAIVDRTALIYVETPSNPLLRVVDLQAVSQIARARNVLSVCDNTFATPINQRPLEWGIDIVVHSATKYLSGHSDVMAGAIVGTKAAIDRAWETSLTLGATLGAIDAWLLLRGLRTLALRVARHNENALALAKFLHGHRRVASVYYPGLDTHPEHALALRQMRGFGGVLSFSVEGGFDAAVNVAERLRIPIQAPSVGAVESLVVHPASLWGRSSERSLEEAGIEPGLLRLSAGIESTDALIADLDQALG